MAMTPDEWAQHIKDIRGGAGVSRLTQEPLGGLPQATRATTTTRAIGALPELPEFAGLDEEKMRSRTQELSALGRREARGSFQDLLSRIYGATPDDPYARNLARTASRGFSMDIQRAISAGGREALSVGLQEQQQRNQRRMAAYDAAVNAVLAGVTTTTTEGQWTQDQPTRWEGRYGQPMHTPQYH